MTLQAAHLSQMSTVRLERYESVIESLLKLKPYIDNPKSQEVAINSPGVVQTWQSGVWIEHPDPAITYDYLDGLGTNVAGFLDVQFDASHPVFSGDLPTGERVQFIRPPASPYGEIYINIRSHIVDSFPFVKYHEQGYFKDTRHVHSLTMTNEDREKFRPHLEPEELELWRLAQEGDWVNFYTLAVHHYQSIVTAGSTGSGKTTFSRSLMELVDPLERFSTLQDARETPMPNHTNRQDLAFIKGDMYELDALGTKRKRPGMSAKEGLEASMRSTPTRIHINELRGDETMYYLSGVLSSGHPGGITTSHANSPKDCFVRLALLIKQSEEGRSIELEAIKLMLYQSINVIGHLKFDKIQKRRLMTAIYYDPFYRMSLLG